MNRPIIYKPGSSLRDPGKLFADAIRDALVSRELGWRLFVRDISSRYRQSLLGYFWFIIPPVIASVPFIFLNSQGIMSVGKTAVPYAVFALVSTTIWQTFVDAINAPLRVTTASKDVLTKINLPREAILLSAFYQAAFGLVVRLLLIAVIMAAFGIAPAATAPMALIGLLALLLFGFMIGVMLTPIGLLYNDVTNILPMFTTFLMFLTPVVYPVPTTGTAADFAAWNPLTPLVSYTRDWLLVGHTDYGWQTMVILAATLALLLLGWLVFRVAMPHLIARLGN